MTSALLSGEASRQQTKWQEVTYTPARPPQEPRQPELARDHAMSAPKRKNCSGKRKKWLTTRRMKPYAKSYLLFIGPFHCKKKNYVCALEKKQHPSLKSHTEIRVKIQILRCYNCTCSLPTPFLGTLGEILAE